MVSSLRPDVVLMDLRMPSSNGFQATEQIVQEHPAVPVVVLSAHETEESAKAVRAAGAFAFLPKHCGADRIKTPSSPPGAPNTPAPCALGLLRQRPGRIAETRLCRGTSCAGG